MSRSLGPPIKYNCANDCEQCGCPGHEIREQFDRSTDIFTFLIDGKAEYFFDENAFEALLKAHQAARGREA